MAARFLLDTNICIFTRRQRPGKALKRFQKLEPGDLDSQSATTIYASPRTPKRQG
jgi:predicted nucleic acid-binding protein